MDMAENPAGAANSEWSEPAAGKAVLYKCPACGAPLRFDPAAQSVLCESCGNTFPIDVIEEVAKADTGTTEFNWSDYREKLRAGEERLDVNVYNCESCGAIIEADKNTAATKCPYCENNVVLSDRVSGGLKPNAIIPFKITKATLGKAINDFYGDKKLLPKDFFSQNVIEKAQGVYVPFWLFDADMSGTVNLNATRVHSFPLGDEMITETSHYLLVREGEMSFDGVPVDASVKMDNDLMDSIEPYDFSELVPFDGAYLTGYVADRFDSGPDDEFDRANRRMQNSMTDVLAGTASAYMGASIRSADMTVTDASVRYVFLPVYVLHCQYKGKKYRYAVNGQTGKVVGELPVSKSKGAAAFLIPFIITTVIVGGILSAIGLF